MINNSKILTVSYGTFSCTLEGFDDSFGTMKAIAEYFRDLAADDRYFGAEPPTPDAEMLARIAEREIERRVQAHEDGGKIVLRAEQAQPAALTADSMQEAPKAEAAAPAPAAHTEEPHFTAPMPAAPAPDVEEMPTAETHDAAETDDAAETHDAAETDDAADAEAEIAPASDDAAAPDADFAASIAALTAEENLEETAENAKYEPEVALVEEYVEPEETETAAEDDTTEVEADSGDDAEECAAPAESFAEFIGEQTDDMPDYPAEDMTGYEAADMSEAPQNEPEFTQVIEDTTEVPHHDPDSVAAKLRRIRSVVAQSEESYADTDYSEDEHAQDFLDETAAELDAVLAEDDAAELDVAEVEDTGEVFAEAQDDTEALLSNIDAHVKEAEAEPDVSEHVAQDEDDEDAAEEDTLAQLLADAMPEGSAEAEAEDDAELAAETVEEIEAERPLDARVVKMKRSAVDEALASGELVEERAEEDTVNLFSDEAEDGFDNSLSAEEEAELQRELAEVEADFAPDVEDEPEAAYMDEAEVDEADAEVTAEDPDQATFDVEEDEFQEALDDASTTTARGVDRLQAVEKTSDVSRIFDEVDSQRDAPESSERRNAIQHLRAAVAATRADQNAGVDISNDKDDSAYRSDLADMVRPRRPRADGTARSERPGMERPAPLKLVAEQRIDTPRDPVQPRRIRTSDITDEAMQATGDTSGSFAEFAEEMGAGSLPELLEAAAAYMADVEGRPQFSRPMLMGKLKEVEGESFSREDGLRSFGQLLRQGKLQKLQGGRFAVTDETEFRIEARDAG